MQNNFESVIIVGAGHSGTKTAATLRKHGWKGIIDVYGNEVEIPYDRPPLSKEVLLGTKTVDECIFYDSDWYEKNNIRLHLNKTVAKINRLKNEIELISGEMCTYNKLILATGVQPNPLSIPGANLKNVWPLRTASQASAIAFGLQPGKRVVIIGAGVIGLEVAAAAITKGCFVQIVESAPQAMGRCLPNLVSKALIDEHTKRGVEVHFNTSVELLAGETTVEAVYLKNGKILPCDILIYGVGVKPNIDLAEDAGLLVKNGIQTNSYLQTSDTDIYACGDVCNYYSKRYDQSLRIENWRNAEDQASIVARNIIGESIEFDSVPWFWSNQFNISLQVVGLPVIGDEVEERTVGNSRLFYSYNKYGLCGISGLGQVRDIARPIQEYRRN